MHTLLLWAHRYVRWHTALALPVHTLCCRPPSCEVCSLQCSNSFFCTCLTDRGVNFSTCSHNVDVKALEKLHFLVCSCARSLPASWATLLIESNLRDWGHTCKDGGKKRVQKPVRLEILYHSLTQNWSIISWISGWIKWWMLLFSKFG